MDRLYKDGLLQTVADVMMRLKIQRRFKSEVFFSCSGQNSLHTILTMILVGNGLDSLEDGKFPMYFPTRLKNLPSKKSQASSCFFIGRLLSSP